jgi:hypothetical protein
MTLEIIISALVIILANNAFVQTLHDRTLDESVKQPSGLNNNPQIDVGDPTC